MGGGLLVVDGQQDVVFGEEVLSATPLGEAVEGGLALVGGLAALGGTRGE